MVNIYESRIIPALKQIKGNNILDIGCVGMGKNDVIGGCDFIFGELSLKYENVIGMDINKKGAEKLIGRGFKVIIQDAQEPYDLNMKFDTIVSEENIEHIANLKTYLENIRNHLNVGGRLVLSTPNACFLDFMIHMFIWRKPRVNQYHTHVHTLDTITYLLNMHGFNVIYYEYLQAIPKKMNINQRICKWIVRWFPERFGRTILLVAENAFNN